MKVTIARAGGYNPALGAKYPDNQDPTLEAHVVKIDTCEPDCLSPEPEYRWRCLCGRLGGWMRNARSARNGGARHVAAMEKK